MRVNNMGPTAMSATFGTMLDVGVTVPSLLLGNQAPMDSVEVGGAVVHGVAALFAGVGTVVGATTPAAGFALTGGQLVQTAGYALTASGQNPLIGASMIAGGAIATMIGSVMNDNVQAGY
jgi:hypothetical protein